jgi:hypothetical protein
MVMIRFTKFVGKVMDHTKTRTIRKKRKCSCGASIKAYGVLPGKALYKRDKCICQIKVGQELQVYAVIKLGTAIVSNVQTLDLTTITDEEAQLDGFKNVHHLLTTFTEMYGEEFGREEFRVIDFAPNWKPQYMGTKEELHSISDCEWESTDEEVQEAIEFFKEKLK